MGEAVKKIPQEIKDQNSAVPWKDIAGIRDIIVHEIAMIGINHQTKMIL